MKEVVVLSGKGGTGKTSIVASFAALAQSKVLADCDVDAADLHLLLEPEVLEAHDFVGGLEAVIDPDSCIACGRCAEMCHFHAIGVGDTDDEGNPVNYRIDDYALHAAPYTLFRVPAATGSFEILSDFLFGRMVGLPERKYPVALGVTLGIDEKAEVALPDGFVVENLPDAVDFEAGAVSLSMTYEYVSPASGGGFIRYNRKFGIDSFEISPEDYLNLKEAVRLAGRSEKGEVILKREEG